MGVVWLLQQTALCPNGDLTILPFIGLAHEVLCGTRDDLVTGESFGDFC